MIIIYFFFCYLWFKFCNTVSKTIKFFPSKTKQCHSEKQRQIFLYDTRQWFAMGQRFTSRGYLTVPGDLLILTTGTEGILQASYRSRPLLSAYVLKCSGQTLREDSSNLQHRKCRGQETLSPTEAARQGMLLMSTHVQNHLHTHMHIPEECWVCMHTKASAFNSVFSKMISLSFSYSLGFIVFYVSLVVFC